MGEIFKLFGTIGIDNKEANNALDSTESKGRSTADKLTGFFKKAAAGIAAVFAIDKLINFGKLSVEAAAGAQAMNAQFEQVFGKLQPQAQSAIDKMAKEFGMVPTRLRPGMTKMTSMFKGLGMDTEEAMGKATTAVRLSADAAAFYDVSFEDANASLSSFLKGNYEAGESIGIFANDTQLAAFAVKEGVVGATKEWTSLDEATKQATRLEYAQNMQKLAGATGQATRESDGYENQMGNVKQAWENFLAIVGAPVLGIVVNALKGITGGLQSIGERLQTVMPDFSNFQQVATNALDAVGNSGFAKNLQWSFQFVSGAIQNTVNLVKEQLPGIQATFSTVFDSAGRVLTKVGGIIGGWATTFAEVFQYVVPAAISIFSSAFEGIASFVMPILDGIVDAVWEISSAVTEAIINNVVPAMKGFSETIEKNKGLIDGLMVVVAGVAGAFAAYKAVIIASKVAHEIYNAAMFASTLATKGLDAATVAMAGAQGASTLATKLNVAAVKGATLAQKLFNLAMNANPIMIVVTLLAALAAGFIYLWKTNDGFREGVINAWNAIKDGAQQIFGALGEFFTGIWQGIKDNASAAWEGFSAWISGIWQGVVDVAQGIWQGLVDVFSFIWVAIKEVFSLYWTLISTLLIVAWNAIVAVAQAIWQPLVQFFTVVWDGIKQVFTTTVNGIAAFLSPIWNAISGTIKTVFNAIKNFFSAVWSGIKSVITTAVNAIKTVITTVFNTVKGVVTTIFSAVKTVITNVWNGIKTVVTNVVNAIKTVVSNVFTAVRDKVSEIWNGIKNTTQELWEGIKTTISNVVNGIKSTVSNIFESLKSTVSSVWNGIKNAISTPINAARDAVKAAIDKIKGFFNVKLRFPHIDMPHFSISGSFSLKPPSVPHIGVDWYAKGGIMQKAMAFGMNGDNLMVGGEAGKEAILPLDRDNLAGIGAGIAKEMGYGDAAVVSKLDELINVLTDLFAGLQDLQVVMDSGALVGSIKDKINEVLGRDQIYRGRGR